MFNRSLIASASALATALVLAEPAYTQSMPLAGSEWRPTVIDGVEIAAESGIFIQFGADGEARGSGGCNRFAGSYQVSGDKITFSPLAATRMACPQPVMANETRFFSALDRVKRFSRERIELELTDDAGNPVILLAQTDAD